MTNTHIEVASRKSVISNTFSSVSTTLSGSGSVIHSKIAQLITTMLLGLVLIFIVGFAPMDVAHNAAHDSRHSHAFPCH